MEKLEQFSLISLLLVTVRTRRTIFETLKCRGAIILGDPGADSGDEGKSKRAEKYIWNEEK